MDERERKRERWDDGMKKDGGREERALGIFPVY
jgi:hypothetical protein